VLLTPRPMADEELAMPTTTAAPTTKGASEVSSLEPSDSGPLPHLPRRHAPHPYPPP
jgi:hypothetical protein